MTIAGMIAGVILIIIALIAVATPFLEQRRRENRDIAAALSQKKRDELLTSYERVLATISDLDEDHQTGKLAPETYQQEREYWVEQGILLLQALESEVDSDSNEGEAPAGGATDIVVDEALDEAIEKAIADYRKTQA